MANTPHTHWKKVQGNSDYLGAWSLDEGKDLIVTIKSVGRESVNGADGKKEDCMVIHFAEAGVLPMVCNATNAKTIAKLFKSPYVDDWCGRAIQLYVDKVKAFGDVVEALRVRSFIPKVTVAKQTEYFCTDCGQKLTAYGKMSPAQLAQYTQTKYGKSLCPDCAAKASVDKTEDDKKANDLTAALQDDEDQSKPKQNEPKRSEPNQNDKIETDKSDSEK